MCVDEKAVYATGRYAVLSVVIESSPGSGPPREHATLVACRGLSIDALGGDALKSSMFAMVLQCAQHKAVEKYFTRLFDSPYRHLHAGYPASI